MEQVKSKLNILYWVLAITFIIAGIVANYHFTEIIWTYRLASWLFLVGIEIVVLAQTVQGKKFWIFAKEAKVELRKVVWPNREETVKTTMVVAGLVVTMAVILWGLDSVLMWAVGWLTGQRG